MWYQIRGQFVLWIGWSWFVTQAVIAQQQSPTLPLLRFNGRLINDLGEPLEGGLVQFWHTDDNGNYDHPQFNTGGIPLRPDFQYFGTATTSADGTFQFTTYRPGIYPARPVTHIHFKVWWQGSDILTSQFYFLDENGTQPSSLQLSLIPQDDGSSVSNKTIAVDLGLGGTEVITPSQTAGPFYPVVDFFHFDSDMTVVTQSEIAEGETEEDGTLTTTTTNSDAPTEAPSLQSQSPTQLTSAPSTSSEVSTGESDAASTFTLGIVLLICSCGGSIVAMTVL